MQVTIGGDRYNYATEYYSGKKIMFTGDFTKMLNGDSAIMFGIYKGTDVNDIPGFDAYFLEFHNGDFQKIYNFVRFFVELYIMI